MKTIGYSRFARPTLCAYSVCLAVTLLLVVFSIPATRAQDFARQTSSASDKKEEEERKGAGPRVFTYTYDDQESEDSAFDDGFERPARDQYLQVRGARDLREYEEQKARQARAYRRTQLEAAFGMPALTEYALDHSTSPTKMRDRTEGGLKLIPGVFDSSSRGVETSYNPELWRVFGETFRTIPKETPEGEPLRELEGSREPLKFSNTDFTSGAADPGNKASPGDE